MKQKIEYCEETNDWCITITYANGDVESIPGFKTEAEAKAFDIFPMAYPSIDPGRRYADGRCSASLRLTTARRCDRM